jgi:MFS family permease
MDLTLELSSRRERPFYLAAFAATGGAGFAVAAVLAGLLASRLPAHFELFGERWANLHVLFVLSALARVAAAVTAFRIEEPGAEDVRTLVRRGLHRATAVLVPRRLTA